MVLAGRLTKSYRNNTPDKGSAHWPPRRCDNRDSTHIIHIAVEQLARSRDAYVGQNDHIAGLQLLRHSSSLHIPNLPHQACSSTATELLAQGMHCQDNKARLCAIP